jgi:hypothetical protein
MTTSNDSTSTATHGRTRPSLGRAFVLSAGLLLIAGAAAACSSDSSSNEDASTVSAGVQAALVEVHSAPGCGCCAGWAEYMESHGYTVETIEDADLADFKAARGVPAQAQSCHTAVIDGYTVEGHVPAEAIEDLLTERPDIDGIALPGMPSGSPGMPGEKLAPFEVLVIDDGATSVFGEY